tara:strand:+ start:140 stop:391 length:252 start_codon:yes stop_codon:yes gene_type:complete
MKSRRLSEKDVAKLMELENLLQRVILKKGRLKTIPNSESRIEKGLQIQQALTRSMIWLEKGFRGKLGEELSLLRDLGIKFREN